MADNFTDAFPHGLGDLPMEPPDMFNGSYAPNRPGQMGTPPIAEPQVIQAGFRLPYPQPVPPGPWQLPGQSYPPIRMPQIPEWWKAVGATLQALPIIVTGSFGANGKYDDPACQEEWADALDFCAKELSKPYPNRIATGGHTSIENCARGRVTERCGGNPKDDPLSPKSSKSSKPSKPSRR